ncbi:OLC1v1028486C1 [Oldenlandia corymbosa var. corymbosa]|uniref:OLC1v1028486C1 n=1 Tax=Oldenlandia corymbosa var. corymbosa TaxID=529605 RepID=A0AAV1CD09_OLDCO|nr:OLC1v1028486C1 [Oldenlandia corymbosa var. corymbosa]
MVERFFRLPQIDFHSPRDDGNHPSQPQILLVSGPPSCGKSSLLFQFAFNSASHGTSSSSTCSTVVFLCNRRKLETNPPFLSQGIDPSSQVFERIQMKYVDDDEGIKKYFAGFHLHNSTFPALVVIDDFADFFDQRNCQERYGNARGRELAMVRVLALCQNALSHANEAGWPCRLLLSDSQHGDSPRFLYIYKRWVSSIYNIQGFIQL